MKKILLLTYLMIITYHSNGQLNIDSLFGSMKSYNLIKKSENSGFTELTFNKENENLTYQFTTDNNGKIADNAWGNCLLILKKDSIGRLIEQHTYNKKGNLFGADSPPVIKIKYRDDVHIKQTDYYNSNLSFVERIEVYYDSIGGEIALIGYDKNLKMTTKQTTDYLDSDNSKIKKFFDSNNQITINDCGVSIWYTRTDKVYGFEVERRYLDKDSNLVDCVHDEPGIKFAYNIATPNGKKKEWKMSYYNKNGKIVRDFIFKHEE